MLRQTTVFPTPNLSLLHIWLGKGHLFGEGGYYPKHPLHIDHTLRLDAFIMNKMFGGETCNPRNLKYMKEGSNMDRGRVHVRL